MYHIKSGQKMLEKLEKVDFASTGLKERTDIQEWIVSAPDILGEELLIIQKEFDAFENINDRLDLLALDKAGNLVVIENKRDDSGKDVVWQIIKYASYCSTFTRENVISIYSKYLKTYCNKDESDDEVETRIKDFIGEDKRFPSDLQRLMLVSRKFDKRVMSAADWLLKNGIDITCVELIPYKYNNDLFIDANIILPQEEMKDYCIKLARKTISQIKEIQDETRRRKQYVEFWQILGKIITEKKTESGKVLFDNKTWTRDYNWINAKAPGINISGISYMFSFSRKGAEILLYIDTADKEKNKKIYKFLYSKKEEIENKLKLSDYEMIWDEKPDCKYSKMGICISKIFMEDTDAKEKLADQMANGMIALDKVLNDYKNEIKNANNYQ